MKLYGIIVAAKIIRVCSIASIISTTNLNEPLAIAAVNIVVKCSGLSERWPEILILSDPASRRILDKINYESRTSNLIISLLNMKDNGFVPPKEISDNFNITSQWPEFKPAAIIVMTRSTEQLEYQLSFLKNDIQTLWQPRSAFLIIRESRCDIDELDKMFKVIWDHWILNAVILCSTNESTDENRSEIELYTFNPYSADHSEEWETIIEETVEVSITPGSFNHSWYIFKRRFIEIGSHKYCDNVFFDKTLNLDNYVIPVSVGYSEFFLDTFVSGPARIFAADSRTMKTLAKKLRFTVAWVFNDDLIAWGQLLQNGSYTSMLDDIHKGLSHLAPTRRGIASYPGIEMTYPHHRSHACFASAIAANRPQWTNLADARNIWIALGLGVIFTTVVLYMQNTSNGIVSAFLDAERLLVGSSIIHMPLVIKHRIILGSIFLVILVVDGAIRGRFISILTVVKPYPNLDTIEQLNEQGVDVYGHSIIKGMISDSQIKSRFEDIHWLTDCMDGILDAKRRRACFADCLVLQRVALNSSDIHVSSTPSRLQYTAFLTTMHWPITYRYSFGVQKLVESGIYDKWQSEIYRLAEVDGWKLKRARIQPSVKSLELSDVLPAFMLLFIGLLLATIIFVSEIKENIINFFCIKY